RSSAPSKTIEPSSGSTSRNRVRATVDLPQPDSPTSPRDWPRATSNDTLLTALTICLGPPSSPPPLSKRLVRCSTFSNGVIVILQLVPLERDSAPAGAVPAKVSVRGAVPDSVVHAGGTVLQTCSL